MKKLLAFFTSLILFATAVIVIHHMMINDKGVKNEGFKTWSNMYKDLSYSAISTNIDKDTMLMFGSSEFTHERKSPFHPARFLPKEGVDAMLIGGAFNQSLYHSIALGALEPDLKNKKVVLVLSPTWFYKAGISDSRYSLRFSESQYIEFLKNPDISMDIKKYVAGRSEKLLKCNSTMQTTVKRLNNIYLNNKCSFLDKIYTNMREVFISDKEALAVKTAFKETRKLYPFEKFRPDAKKTDFKKLMREASAGEAKYSRDNEFFMREKGFNKLDGRISGKYKDSHINDNFDTSPEYEDLECFLKICKENKIKALIVLLPINGYWYDYTGMNEQAREGFKVNTIKLANQYDAEVADYFDRQYDKDFLIDEVHPTGKGWLMINEKICQFYKK